MNLVDWRPKNWYSIKQDLIGECKDERQDIDELLEGVRRALLSELQKKVIKFQHSCNPCLTGLEVKDPTLVIEPPMYLIDLGDPLK